jgi:hypothetical protein
MNAPFRTAAKPNRFPRLSPAQKLLQAAADREIFREIIAEMNLQPGIAPGSCNRDRLSFNAWGKRR